MKKILALLLAGVLLFGLVACGGEGEKPKNTDGTTTTTTMAKGATTTTTTTAVTTTTTKPPETDDDEFYMLSDILMIKIAKAYALTCSLYEFDEGDQVPFNKIFYYFTFEACYSFDEKMLEPTMLPYYNEDDFTFSVPHEIVDAYLVERFNTTPDPESVECYNPKTGCYDFDRHLGEFYYQMTLNGKRYISRNKYQFDVTLTHDIDSEAIPPQKLSFTVQLTRDGYKILAYSREKA